MTNHKALAYHTAFPQGKTATMPSKRLQDIADFALGYTPHVAVPCNAIFQDVDKVYSYTNKSNLLAVVTNGSAVPDLGCIGPEAAKPVMEGKVALLKVLAGIDAFDLEIGTQDPAKILYLLTQVAPTFGGMVVEAVEVSQRLYLRKKLQQALPIPVMCDAQQRTAIVVGAALQNAVAIAGKKVNHLRTVIYGEGAGTIATASLLLAMGVSPQGIVMFDRRGVIHQERAHLPDVVKRFAIHRPMGFVDAMYGADFFLDFGIGNLLTADHLRCMAHKPILFSLANVQPTIDGRRSDLIMATTTPNTPNQIHEMLAFPYICRGLLDTQATGLDDGIPMAAVKAIASLAHQTKGSSEHPALGKYRLLPQLLDKRLLPVVATAVAQAVIKAKRARSTIDDWQDYHTYLAKRINFKP